MTDTLTVSMMDEVEQEYSRARQDGHHHTGRTLFAVRCFAQRWKAREQEVRGGGGVRCDQAASTPL